MNEDKELEEIKKECDFIRKNEDDYIVYGCSNCNEEWYFEDGTPKDNLYNYCPKELLEINNTKKLKKSQRE